MKMGEEIFFQKMKLIKNKLSIYKNKRQMNTRKPTFFISLKKITALVLIAFCTPLFINLAKAQAQEPLCGSEKYLEEQQSLDPLLKTRMDVIRSEAMQVMTHKGSTNTTAASTITIPVVVHVVYNTSTQNIPDAQIQSQIDVLNEDYSRLNADSNNTPSAFKPFAAKANIQFVLAKRDPNGNATNGITRTATNLTSFSTNNYVKFDNYGGKNAWNTTQYLNIWVCNLSGYGGYAAMPGETASIDGVVINYLCFGRIGTLMSTRNKGRAATHEIGHWLGLAHTWGWSGTCGDDAIADTPTQEKANSGIPVFPHVSSCSPNSNGDMFMNYMDYSNDVALNMFTLNQASVMNATLNGYRGGILSSQGGIAPGSVTCNIPSGLNATGVTANDATLNWVTTGASGYTLRYKPSVSNTWDTISVLSNSVTLTGLTPSTNYECQLATVCSNGSVSAFSGSFNFTTAATTVTWLTIGNSNIVMPDAPYGTAYVKERAQFIVTKNELVAAGYTTANNAINSLSFFVNTASSSSLNSFTIKIAHTSVSSFAAPNFLNVSAATTVYSSTFLTTAASWNKHAFSNLFIYNGNDNLLIDITWSNTSASTSSSVYGTSGASGKTLYYGANNLKTNIGKVRSGILSSIRPNMMFEFVAPSSRVSAIETGIEALTPKHNPFEMELFPNPVTSTMNLSFPGISESGALKIRIFNISGVLVAKYESVLDEEAKPVFLLDFNSDLELQNLADGIYICSVDIEGTLVNRKFILRRN